MPKPFLSTGPWTLSLRANVLEHLHFPLAALRVWCNALMPGGILLLRVPDKRFTFDAPRQRTSLDHLVLEEAAPEAYDPGSHYADWVEHIHKTSPAQSNFERKVKELLDRKFSIHFHVWTDVDVREILNYTINEWKLPWRPVFSLHAHFYRKEAVVVLQKDSEIGQSGCGDLTLNNNVLLVSESHR